MAKPCKTWKAAEGAAWAWCDTCGVRGDLHPGCPYAAALTRIVKRNDV